jgi:hypothetical protein
MGTKKRHNRPYYNLVLTDRQVADACKLRGVKMEYFNDVLPIIEQAYQCTLVRWQSMRSPLGGEYGRWEVLTKSTGARFPSA